MKNNKFRKQVEQKFSWDIDTLGEYVEEQSPEIIPSLINDGRTASLIPVMEGVKHKDRIKLFSTELVLQSAATCGWNALGSAVFTDDEMEVAPIKVNLAFCSENLNGAWTQLGLPNGVRNQRENLPYNDLVISHFRKQVMLANEKLIWIGDTGSVDPNINQFDGFKVLFDADGTVSDLNLTNVTAFTQNNIIGILQDMVVALDVTVRAAAHKIFVGQEVFDLYKLALANANLYHQTPDMAADTIQIFGTSTMMERVTGLDGTNSIYAGPTDFMRIGTDLESDWEDFSIRYDDNADEVRVKIQYRLGVKYVYGNLFKKYLLATS